MLFVGNVGIKPATSPLIRRFGFRVVLIASIAGGAVVFGLIATLSAASPLPMVVACCCSAGSSGPWVSARTTRCSSPTSTRRQMSDASTLSSTMQQVAAALGIAVGAVVVRVADNDPRPVGPARLALPGGLCRVGLLMLWPLVEAIRLHRGAGDEVAAR